MRPRALEAVEVVVADVTAVAHAPAELVEQMTTTTMSTPTRTMRLLRRREAVEAAVVEDAVRPRIRT